MYRSSKARRPARRELSNKCPTRIAQREDEDVKFKFINLLRQVRSGAI
jgi:hypothetical protein